MKLLYLLAILGLATKTTARYFGIRFPTNGPMYVHLAQEEESVESHMRNVPPSRRSRMPTIPKKTYSWRKSWMIIFKNMNLENENIFVSEHS